MRNAHFCLSRLGQNPSKIIFKRHTHPLRRLYQKKIPKHIGKQSLELSKTVQNGRSGTVENELSSVCSVAPPPGAFAPLPTRPLPLCPGRFMTVKNRKMDPSQLRKYSKTWIRIIITFFLRQQQAKRRRAMQKGVSSFQIENTKQVTYTDPSGFRRS